jgi:glycosyltransferase involved in cell wall biosynthesis
VVCVRVLGGFFVLLDFAELQPDLIHLNNGVRSDTPGILAAKKCGVPAVCHVRTFSKLTYLNIAAARSITTFICISNAVRDTLVDYGIDSDRCVVVANAVDPAQFKTSGGSATDIRGEFGFDKSDVIFALVGRVVSWKGHDYFLKAIAKARETNDKVKGLIVGDAGPADKNKAYESSLRSLIRSLKIDDAVRFTGHRTDIPDIMQSSDVVVCASSEPEPFGRVIIESMAMGTTVIATDAGGASDIIEHEVNGLLVPTKDSTALALAMLRLVEESELSVRLRSAATGVMRDRYTVGRHVDAVLDIYRTVTEIY